MKVEQRTSTIITLTQDDVNELLSAIAAIENRAKYLYNEGVALTTTEATVAILAINDRIRVLNNVRNLIDSL